MVRCSTLSAMKRFAALIALATMLAGGAAPAQVPPPPDLPGQADIAIRLAEAFAHKDAAAYADLLADDLQVFEDGKQIASGKQEWMASFGRKLAAPGVQFHLISGYSSTGRILFIEYFNSLASWGRTPPPDCCWGYDAVAYDVADGKITRVQRLPGGHARLAEDGRKIAE